MQKNPSVAVIGAGLAGLACATALQAAGCAVLVLDKSRGPGGRMSTRRGDGWQCDHGAQYFTARDPRFILEVDRWQAAGAAGLWQPRLAVLGDADRHQTDANLRRYVGTPRMTAPARFLADELSVMLACTVDGITKTAAGWQVCSREHGALPQLFDAVVVAVPAPQAAPLLESVAVSLAQIARQAVMRAAWALMLHYDAAVDLPFDAAFVNGSPLRWITRESSKPGRPARETWLLHATAAWSERHVEADAGSVAAALLKAFADLGAPPPAAWTAHRWRYADSEPALMLGHCWEPAQQLGLCGDWLNGGKVEGAWLSGQQLAEAIIGANRLC